MNSSGEQCYSGGLDSIISVWNIPNSEVDPYDSYGKNFIRVFFFSYHYFLYLKIQMFYVKC